MLAARMRCDECGGVLVPHRGEYVCKECGLVHDRILVGVSHNGEGTLDIPKRKLTRKEREKERKINKLMLYYAYDNSIPSPVKNCVKMITSQLECPQELYIRIIQTLKKIITLPDGSSIEKMIYAIYYELLRAGRIDVPIKRIINMAVELGFNTNYRRVAKFISRNMLYKNIKPLKEGFAKRFLWDIVSKFITMSGIKLDFFELYKKTLALADKVETGHRAHYYFLLYYVLRREGVQISFNRFCNVMGVNFKYATYIYFRKNNLRK